MASSEIGFVSICRYFASMAQRLYIGFASWCYIFYDVTSIFYIQTDVMRISDQNSRTGDFYLPDVVMKVLLVHTLVCCGIGSAQLWYFSYVNGVKTGVSGL